MAINIEKNGEERDIVITGFENGIQPSPHRGIGNIQNANISTETTEVMASFSRYQETMTDTVATGTLTFVDTSHVALSIANTNNRFKGNWIVVTNSSNTGQLPNGTYYVPASSGANFQLANYYNTQASAQTATASYLIVGGGGNGGTSAGGAGSGGGGGGQVRTGTTSLSAGTTAITVGIANTNSNAFSVTATAGANGNPSSGTTPGTGGTSGSGNSGGGGGGTGNGGGGGGGDSAVGNAPTGTAGNGGNGGNGTASTITGTSVAYGGGGGGASVGAHTGGTGGSGGGGAGSSNTPVAGTNGLGGGGGGTGTGTGAAGGVGAVIISYPTLSIIGATGGTITSYTDGGGVSHNVHTFTSSGNFVIPALPPAAPITGFTTGLTATIQMVATMGKPLASTTETYRNNGTVYNRYYVLDNNNLVWVYDTQNESTYVASDNVSWFLPDFHTDWCTSASGIAVISGFLVGLAESGAYGKSVALLGNTNTTATTWVQFPDVLGWNGATGSLTIPHFGYVGHQGNLYVTDANYIANIYPNATLSDASATSANIQTFCSVVPISISEGMYSIISGTSPVTPDGKRLPIVFFTTNTGALPTTITGGTIYYISANDANFQVFTGATGGSPLDIFSGQQGPLYFNSFYPVASATASTGGTPTYLFENQRLALPYFEIAQCMTEVGNLIIVGCVSSTIYPWNQVNNSYSSIISLPEANVPVIITVNQMAYILAGNKGNIYITDGSVASLVTTVPDYCAGVPGTPTSYIEPVFSWGGAMYLRGRVYFSILDQTTAKAGNCGGIWSFVPTQNFYVGQDVGIGLRLENQSSYGTYNGYAPVLIAKVNQNAIAPQYFNAWQSDITTSVYGIDATGTGTNVSSVAVIETDYIPTGTMLQKKTFKQIEYKTASPLLAGETITMNYRVNMTDAWTSMGTVVTDTPLSGYYVSPFERIQGLQLQVILTPTTSTTSSFNRLLEIRIR